MNSMLDQVLASYHRARNSGELFDTLYDLFLGKSPEIPPMFAGTDFPHQKRLLQQSLLELLAFFQTGSGRGEIERLGELHRQLNVKVEHYELWLDALCEALAKHDPKFNDELERVWRRALQPAIELMSAAPSHCGAEKRRGAFIPDSRP
jgi:hemoglobin-like flavoprotein